MTWRSLIISRPAGLRIEQNALVVAQENEARVPLEDIAVIVLDNPAINLTHPLLSACAEHGIGLYSTGEDHHPNGVFLSFLGHNRSTRRWREQQRVGRPRIKQLWAALITRKIENQAASLRLAGCSGENHISSLARRVRSGDPDNLESQAALAYFTSLFGAHFTRKDATWINAALNYGYAVLRGSIARGLVAHGLHPSIGLVHDNERNAFNLADDLIEPFRPLVDVHVFQNKPDDLKRRLQTSDKVNLVSLLNTDMEMPRGIMSTLNAIEQAIESLARSYTAVKPVLELPQLIGLDQHQPEI